MNKEIEEGQLGDGAAEMSTAIDKEPYCMPFHVYRTVTTDLEDSWCLYDETLRFASVVMALLNEYQFELPKGIYIVCGEKAYRWIPKGAEGTCTLARLEPATWVWNEEDFPYKNIPQHMLAKRDTDTNSDKQTKKHLFSTPWYAQAGMVLTGPLGVMLGTVRNTQMIQELGDIFDNVTDLLFDAINIESAYTKQLIIITNQHSMVLDYLTASSGGFCQVVGPSCRHFINPEGLMQVTHDINQAERLKKGFKEANALGELPFPSWLSWLNPLNLFKGVGGWITGIIHYVIQGAFIILVIAVLIKLFVMLVKKILGANCNCFS
ncbi:syncytin-1-like isoform 1-T3 [Anomaloglossus baeobatrachus]|uniref:syncytin-1-like n=1 Tax=Anomaloglossus baeobatrachus TaxID=238106 RepID=UPI003F50AA26